MVTISQKQPIIIHTARSRHTRFLAALCILLLIIIATLTVTFLTINDKLKKTNSSETEYISIVNKVRNSIVAIGTEKTAGSGIIIREDGYILTNYHVISEIKENDKIQVLLIDKRIFSAKILGADDKSDIALLKINATNLPVANLGNSDAVKVGEKVIAIGNPFGFESTVTSGIISALHRDRGPTEYKDFIQTDASINPGNSGGPLINADGEVIGLNTFIVGGEKFSGLGFAIPINTAKTVIENLLAYGKVIRSFIGISVQDMVDIGSEGNGRILDGAKIIAVSENTPASKSGLKPGDIINEINNIKVTSANQLRNYVAWLKPNTEIKIKISRNNTEMTIPLTVTEKSDSVEEAVNQTNSDSE